MTEQSDPKAEKWNFIFTQRPVHDVPNGFICNKLGTATRPSVGGQINKRQSTLNELGNEEA